VDNRIDTIEIVLDNGERQKKVISLRYGDIIMLLRTHLFFHFAIWSRYLERKFIRKEKTTIPDIVPYKAVKLYERLDVEYGISSMPIPERFFFFGLFIVPILEKITDGKKLFNSLIRIDRYVQGNGVICDACQNRLTHNLEEPFSCYFYENFVVKIPDNTKEIPQLEDRGFGIESSVMDVVICDDCQDFVAGIKDIVKARADGIEVELNFSEMYSLSGMGVKKDGLEDKDKDK